MVSPTKEDSKPLKDEDATPGKTGLITLVRKSKTAPRIAPQWKSTYGHAIRNPLAGNEDSFSTLPIACDSHMMALLNHCKCLYSISSCVPFTILILVLK